MRSARMRVRAKECRAQAETTDDPDLRRLLTDDAECWEAMAEECERLQRDAGNFGVLLVQAGQTQQRRS